MFGVILFGILLISLPALFHFQKYEGLIGDAIEAFRPCSSGVIAMERIVGGPPKEENYWDGIFFARDKFPNLPEARISLKLNAPANISVDADEGRVLIKRPWYHLSYFKPRNGFTNLKFRVEGKPFGIFPNILNLTLNGEDVCPNPLLWKPSILGIGPAIVDINPANTNATLLTCGKRKILYQALITNGYPSQEGDWPWHAGIFHLSNQNFEYRCGGTVLNTNTIITAAHCVTYGSEFIVAGRVMVKLGLHFRLITNRNTHQSIASKIIPHEQYNFGNLANDIAIIKLLNEVTFTNYIQPICLWPTNEVSLDEVVDKNGIVVGWGLNNIENKSYAEILNQGIMPVVSQFQCLDSNREFFGLFLSESNYCAGFRNGTSVCNGDSGGGMFFERNKTYFIRGIVSLSITKENSNVCNPKQYVIFTDVAKHLDWIYKYL